MFRPISVSIVSRGVVSLTDQLFSVGTIFLVNIFLARMQTKEEYGFFVLSYSIFTFLSGIYNALILEPYSVYGSGKYRQWFPEYFRLMIRAHVMIAFLLNSFFFLVLGLVWLIAPSMVSSSILGLALALSFLLTGSFIRRTYYVKEKPSFAAAISILFFLVVCLGLWILVLTDSLNGFYVFIVLALGWSVAGIFFVRKNDRGELSKSFINSYPRYWKEHWDYSRWVLITAFIFQLTGQGYYWMMASILSVKDLAEFRAVHNIILPIDQFLISLSLLTLPMLSRYYADNLKSNYYYLLRKMNLLAALLTVGFALFIWFFGGFVVHLLYDFKYDSSLSILYLLSTIPIVMGIGNSFNDALKAARKPNIIFYAYIISGMATFAIGTPLVKYFGKIGAAYGMFASSVAYAVTLIVGFYFVVYAKLKPVSC